MRSWKLLFGGLLATAMTVSGCGGSSTDGSASGGSASSEEPIEIGVICACSGPNGAEFTTATKVAQAWAESVNASGGINGHPVDLTIKDDASNPGTSVTIAQSFISADVDAILDLTALDSTWAPAVADAKIPVVAGDLNNPTFYSNAHFYPSGETNDHAVAAYAHTAQAAGATNLGVLYCAEAPSCQEAVDPINAAGAEVGVPVVYTGSIAASAPNFTAQCIAARDAGVKALLVTHVAPVVIRVINDCSRQDYHPIYVTAGSGFSMQLPTSIGAEDEVWTEFPVLPFFADTPAVQELNSAVDEQDPDLRQDKTGWTVGATTAWTGGLLIERAVQAADLGSGDTPTAEAILSGLNSLDGETLEGWAAPLTFTAGQPHSTDCWFTGRTKNGTPELVNDGQLTCEDGSPQ